MADEQQEQKDRFTITVNNRQNGKNFNETFSVENATGVIVQRGRFDTATARFVSEGEDRGIHPGVQKELEGMHVEATGERKRNERRIKVVEVSRDGTGDANVVDSYEESEGADVELSPGVQRQVEQREQQIKQQLEDRKEAEAKAQSSDATASTDVTAPEGRRRRTAEAPSG